MRGARARKIRRAVYGEHSQRERVYEGIRHYKRVHYGPITVVCAGRRAAYQLLKRSYLLALRKRNA